MPTKTFTVVWEFAADMPDTPNPSGVICDPSLEDLAELAYWISYDGRRFDDITAQPSAGGGIDWDEISGASVDGAITVADDAFDALTNDGVLITVYARHPTVSVGFRAQVSWASVSSNTSGFDFTNGNVQDGRVGFVLAGGRANDFGFGSGGRLPAREPVAQGKWESLIDGAVTHTVTIYGAHREPFGDREWRPKSYFDGYADNWPPGADPALINSWYVQKSNFKTEQFEGGIDFSNLIRFSLALGQIIEFSIRVTVNANGYEEMDEYVVPFPPLPIIAAEQNGEQIINGLWNYFTDLSPALALSPSLYPEIEEGELKLDATASYCASGGAVTVLWKKVTGDLETPTLSPDTEGIYTPDDELVTMVGPEEGTVRYGLRVTSIQGLSTPLAIGFLVTGQDVFAPVVTPNGDILFPVHASAATQIRRVREGEDFEIISSIAATQVHLMRHEGTYYAGGKANDNYTLFKSEDSGETWQMLSNFPTGYRVLSWCELEHGGFAAIALGSAEGDRKKLYGAVTWDGVTWTEPTLQRDGGDVTPKGAVRQINATGESHLIVSDAQTYSIRVDDYFKDENPDL